MKIHANKIPAVLQEFAQTRIISKAPSPTLQFGLGFAMPYLTQSVNRMLTDPAGLATALGVVGADGLIDLDAAYKAATSAMASAGGKVQMYGIFFDRSDIDALHEIAQRQGV